jgi:hypothetical protein
MRKCTIDGCSRLHHGRGLCRAHHSRMARHSSLEPMKRGARPVLTYPKIRRIDAAKRGHLKRLAGEFGVSISTIYAARNRRNAYRDCAL